MAHGAYHSQETIGVLLFLSFLSKIGVKQGMNLMGHALFGEEVYPTCSNRIPTPKFKWYPKIYDYILDQCCPGYHSTRIQLLTIGQF